MKTAKAILKELRSDFARYAPRCLSILKKDGQLAPFALNEAQRYIDMRLNAQLDETGMVRALILKGRQQGASTYITGRFYHKTSMRFGTRAFILSHEQQATSNLYAMVRRYHEHVPAPVKPMTGEDSAKSLYFSALDSRFSLATAGTKETGRSATAQLFHGCLSPDSIIVTPDGTPTRMGDMNVGDKVVTHTGAVAPISFVSRKQDAVLRVKVMGGSEPLVATRQHKVWTQDGMAELGTLDVGDCIGYPVSVAGNRHIEWPYRLDYGRRSGRGGAGSVGPDTLAATFDLGRMLGLYLAEGCVLKQSAGGNPSAVTFAIHEKEAARTVAWLAPFRECWRSEPKVTPRQSSKTVTVTVYSRSFAEFVLARCGELDDKKLPTEWRNNAEFAHGLVVGYFSGDGGGQFNKTTRRLQAPSIRGAISFGMRDALAALGYGWATVTHRAGAKRNGRDERAQWTVRLSGQGADRLWAEMRREELPRTRKARKPNMRIENGYAWLPITSIESAGEQSVMDFEIDHPDHSYCTWQGAVSNSEVAFWPNAQKHMAGIGQVVPEIDGTEIVLESTANGIGNLFHSMWLDAIRGQSQYQAIFIPWFWEPGYAKPVPEGFMLDTDETEYMETYGLTMEQMVWRRDKIAALSGDINLFNQEYPASAEMAFMVAATSALIGPQLVGEARATGEIQGYGPLYMGIDPAEYGDDATAIIFRQGRKAFGLRRYHKKGPVQVAGIVAALIDEYKPDAVCIDATGGGGGVGITDMLRDQDYDIYPIRFGASAHDERYKDRRTEIWAHMLHWFQDTPVTIPQDEGLGADLTSLSYGYNNARQLVLESKEHAATNGIPSPDSADALACTFGVRISERHNTRGGPSWKQRLKGSRPRKSTQAA